jgi:hypothetical protein
MGASSFWISFVGVIVLFMVAILWVGQTPYIKPRPYEGPYWQLEQYYKAGDVQNYNELIIKHNFDPFVLKQRNLPQSM